LFLKVNSKKQGKAHLQSAFNCLWGHLQRPCPSMRPPLYRHPYRRRLSRPASLERPSFVALHDDGEVGAGKARVPLSALRDLGDDARIERGWRRLRPSLGPRRHREGLARAALAVALAFGGGVLAGKMVWDRDPPSVALTPSIGPVPATEGGAAPTSPTV